MGSSTLDPIQEGGTITDRGHGTGALGPSDSSDTGSDVVGGPGMDEGLSDEQARRMPQTVRANAGRDLGDADLASDSDRYGTGERGGAGIGTDPNDQRVTVKPGIGSAADELDDPDATDETLAHDRSDVSDGAT